MISTEAVAPRESPADRSGLRSWLDRASLPPVATTECVLFGPDVELAGWRSRSRTRCEYQRFPGSHCRRLPEGNWGLGALADDVALIAAEFSSSAWTHGDLPITVRLWLQDGVVTIEISDAPRSPACAFLRECQRACRARKAQPGRLVLGQRL